MKKSLLVLGVLIIIIGAIALLFSASQGYGYYHLLDGDADMYIGLHRRMIICFVNGIVPVVIAVAYMIIRR